jgi:TM2 domain.
MEENKPERSRVVALLLLVFLGTLGIHNFYLGRRDMAIAELVLTIVSALTFWILIGFATYAVVGILVIIDLIYIVSSKDEHLTWSLIV